MILFYDEIIIFYINQWLISDGVGFEYIMYFLISYSSTKRLCS